MPRNEKKSNVAAVVVTYNRLELLRQCVEALRAQTTACDILIVDNASTDGTANWLTSQPDLNYRNTGSNPESGSFGNPVGSGCASCFCKSSGKTNICKSRCKKVNKKEKDGHPYMEKSKISQWLPCNHFQKEKQRI